MTVSDENKRSLLRCPRFIPLLVTGLFLDPEHPRAGSDHEPMAAVQRDFAEALQQLALWSEGRDALLSDVPLSLSNIAGGHTVAIQPVVPALEALVERALSPEAKECANGALMALGVRQPEHHHMDTQAPRHIMLSYQWDHQNVVQRVHEELVRRGYRTWFDLEHMKGSTADAMSDAIDNAEVMLCESTAVLFSFSVLSSVLSGCRRREPCLQRERQLSLGSELCASARARYDTPDDAKAISAEGLARAFIRFPKQTTRSFLKNEPTTLYMSGAYSRHADVLSIRP